MDKNPKRCIINHLLINYKANIFKQIIRRGNIKYKEKIEFKQDIKIRISQ